MGAQQVLVSTDAAQALAQHLREHPNSVLRNAQELALDFGLPEDFVREVLKGIRGEPKPRTDSGGGPFAFVGAFGRAVNKVFLRLTSLPLLFLGLVTVAVIAVLVVEPPVTTRMVGKKEVIVPMFGAISVLIAGAILHLLTYYRHGRALLAAKGALMGWLITTPLIMIGFWQAMSKTDEVTVSVALLSVALSLLFVWLLYAGVALVVSVLGGYVQLRRETRNERSLTRQQLLERLFEIREKLSSGSGEEKQAGRQLWRKWGLVFNRSPLLMAAVLAFGIHAFKGLLMHGIVAVVNANPGLVVLLIAGAMIVFVIQMFGFATVGYFATSAPRAVLLGLVFLVFAFATDALSEVALGPTNVNVQVSEDGTKTKANTSTDFLDPTQLITNLLFATGLPLIAFAGGLIEEKAQKELRLKREEPSALLAEMVRIQWLLAPTASNLCVMVVDAARSAEMKASADPLNVEYSFREYQNLIDRLARENGGHVHNTMGDGAVVAFDTCAQAFRAGRVLQTEIGAFNGSVNKLDTPFRLRIGLHRGMIAGELEKVEFSEVIDIAAHVQGAAPVGGITLTEAVAEDLPGEALAELRESIDGCKVFLAMNPTLDS